VKLADAIDCLPSLLTGDFRGVLLRLPLAPLKDALTPKGNVLDLYATSLEKSLRTYQERRNPNVGLPDIERLRRMLQEITTADRHLTELNVAGLEGELVGQLRQHGVVDDEDVARDILKHTRDAFQQAIVADDKLRNEIVVYGLQEVRQTISLHQREINGLYGRLRSAETEQADLKGQQQRFEQQINDYLSSLADQEELRELREQLDQLRQMVSQVATLQHLGLRRPRMDAPDVEVVGRDALAQSIKQRLKEVKRLQLYGYPGVGKTTLVQHVASQLAEDYPLGVVWVEVRQIETNQEQARPVLDERLRMIAKAAVEQFFSLKEAEGDIIGFARDLFALPECLLVVDNLEDPELLDLLIERLRPANLLVTSRVAAPDRLATQRVDVLDASAAMKLFRNDAGIPSATEDGAISEICSMLGNLPLAVHLVARDMARVRRTPSEVLKRLRATENLLGEVKYGKGTDPRYR
jgi:DNA replication protein DnaC